MSISISTVLTRYQDRDDRPGRYNDADHDPDNGRERG
ncbi:hypothetical protein QE418_001571 [Microbacterium testaceum]|nr:hypothetical protein [Microbacterium testaceum]